MKRVIVESPFRPLKEAPTDYVIRAMRDALGRGEAPFASHRLYPGVLDDEKADERALGIEAGLQWGSQAMETVVYVDWGVSIGMALGIARAVAEHRPVTLRALDRPEAVDAFAKILNLSPPTDDTVAGLRKQLGIYRQALESEKVARREEGDAWARRWDDAAAALDLTSDELMRRSLKYRNEKTHAAQQSLPTTTF